MVERFRRNAVELGVSDKCDLRTWAELAESDKRYDHVMCRGNSLVYARSWDGGPTVADRASIVDYLEKMVAVLAPGGFLHIDAPREYGLSLRRSATAKRPHPGMPGGNARCLASR
jgi:hypothetical protein